MRSSSIVLRENPLRATDGALPRRPSAATELREVLASAAAGDDDAFAELHRRFCRVVHGIALARVAPSDAEDVVQEVFVRVHGNVSALRDPDAFPAWICTVARNVAADTARRRDRRPPTEPLRDVPAPRNEPTPDEDVRRRVLARLRELPEAYRETLLLRLAEGLTGPEIAARTGLTPGSVRVNLCRGMARLRELLAGEDLR